MKNSWLLICSMLLLLFVACSDDDDDNVIPELPDSDMDISVPERPAEWVPGMPFCSLSRYAGSGSGRESVYDYSGCRGTWSKDYGGAEQPRMGLEYH